MIAIEHFPSLVLQRLAQQRGLSKYALAEHLKDKVAPHTIYDFLSGKKDTSTKVLAIIFDALHIEVKSAEWHTEYGNYQYGLVEKWKAERKQRKNTAT